MALKPENLKCLPFMGDPYYLEPINEGGKSAKTIISFKKTQ